MNFSELRCGQHYSEVHHENGSFIPVSYFVNGPVEGMDIYQVWVAVVTPANNNKSLSELTKTSELSSSLSSSRQESEESSNVAEIEMCSGEYLLHYKVPCHEMFVTTVCSFPNPF